MDTRPVDLAAPPCRQDRCERVAQRWCVAWPSDDAGHWRESYFAERPLAEAYAAAHRCAVIVPLAALAAWPVSVSGSRA